MAPEPSRRAERLYKVMRVVEKGGTQPGFGMSFDNDRFPKIISRVAESRERIVIEQEGKAITVIVQLYRER